jgi:phage shock protein C
MKDRLETLERIATDQPSKLARDIRSRFKDLDRRLADIESYVTTENRTLAREIEQLRQPE